MSDVRKFRKKPVIIEAAQVDSADHDGALDIASWCGGRATGPDDSDGHPTAIIAIDTLEGTMYADPGDYVIRGVQGEFYPCKPDIFDATYEPA